MSWIIERLRKRMIAETGRHGLAERKGEVLKAPTIEDIISHPINIGEYESHYVGNAVVFSAVNALSDMTVGVGYFTEAEHPRAKRVIDDYAEDVGLDEMLLQILRSTLIWGFCPVERFLRNGTLELKPLPPTNVYVRMDKKGKLLGYTQRTWAGTKIQFKPEEIIWFCFNERPGKPYGTSVIEPILTLVRAKKDIIADVTKIVHRYGSPLTIWETSTDITPLKTAVAARKPDEDIFVGNVGKDDVRFRTVEIDPRGRFENYINAIDEEIYEGLQAPILRFLRNATEASAKVQLDVIDRRVAGMQRYIKRKVEREIFTPVIQAHGLTEVPTLRWGRPITGLEDIKITDIAKLFELGAISVKQTLSLLRKMGLPIEEEEPKPQPQLE